MIGMLQCNISLLTSCCNLQLSCKPILAVFLKQVATTTAAVPILKAVCVLLHAAGSMLLESEAQDLPEEHHGSGH